jgi:hypothetical protein
MMSEQRTFAEKVRGGSSARLTPLAWTLGARSLERRRTIQLRWSDNSLAVFTAIADAATRNNKSPLRLPIASLRSILVTCLPGALFVTPDVGGIGLARRDQKVAFFADVVETEQRSPGHAIRAASLWIDNVLAPWAARQTVDPQIVERLRDFVDDRTLVVASDRHIDLRAPVQSDFAGQADVAFALLSERLAGAELFPGLGPVKCEVRSRPRANYLRFLTWPTHQGEGSLWSMVATFSIETIPGHPSPIVRLGVGRRRWCPELPGPVVLRRQRQIAVSMMAQASPLSVQFPAPLTKGEISAGDDPAFVMKALGAGLDLGVAISEHVKRGLQDSAFLGVAMHPGYEMECSVGVGATELDALDCFDLATTLLQPDLVGFDVTPVKTGIHRAVDVHAHIKPIQFLAWAATSGLGHNQLTEDSLEEAWRCLLRDEPPRQLATEDADKALTFFQAAQQANIERIERAFPDGDPVVVVFVRSGDEGAILEEVIRSLFDNRVKVDRRYLPPDVHGARKALPFSDKPGLERYASRVEAWRASAEDLAKRFENGCHVIVQAPRFNDDVVNKPAGRIALATIAKANVQYLNVRGGSLGEYLFRVEAAVLDLLFGHSGLVSETKSAVADAFSGSKRAPKAILGVSVVRRNRRLFGATGSEVLLITRIDVASGQTSAILGKREDGHAVRSREVPFFEALREVAKWGGASLGGEPDTRAATFQRLVDEVVRENCELGRSPIVLMDASTSSNLWPFLRDADVGKPALLNGRPFNPPDDWPGARIIRVRDDVAPRIVTRKATTFRRFDSDGNEEGTFVRQTPTATPGLSRIGLSAIPHFVSMGSNDGKQKIAKGLSVYRSIVYGARVAKDAIPPRLVGRPLLMETSRLLLEESYRLPGAIDITVLAEIEGDSADRMAALTHALRSGFGHSEMMTTLPAPLFFETKLRDYIPSFVIPDEVEEVDGGVEQPSADDQEGEDVERAEPSALDAFSLAKLLGIGNRLNVTAAAQRTLSAPRFGASVTESDTSAFAYRAVSGNEVNAVDRDSDVPEFIPRLERDAPELGALAREVYIGPVPAFITPEWAAQRITTAGQTIRLISSEWDRSAELLQPFAEWPADHVPTAHEFCEIVARLFQAGGGIQALTSVARRVKPKLHFRGVFKPFSDHSARLLFSSKDAPQSLATTAEFQTRLRELAGSHREWVRDFLIIESVHGALAVDWVGIARRLGDDFSDVLPYLERVGAFFDAFKTLTTRYKQYRAARQTASSESSPAVASFDGRKQRESEGVAPSIRIPSFVNIAWLRDKIALSGRAKTDLHEFRATIRSCAGDDEFWPDTQPDTARVEEIILRSLSLPFVLPAISQKFNDGRDGSLFRPFYRKLESILTPLIRQKGDYFESDSVSSASDEEILDALISEKLQDQARSFAVLRGSELTAHDALLNVVKGLPDYREVSEYLDSRKRSVAWARRHNRLPNGVAVANSDRSWASHLSESVETSAAPGESLESGTDQAAVENPTESSTMQEVGLAASSSLVAANQGDVANAQNTYRDAVENLISEAQGVVEFAPAEVSVSRLRVALSKVEAALTEYVEAVDKVPKGVVATGLVSRLSRLRTQIISLSEELEQQVGLPQPPDATARVTEEAAERAVSLTGQAEVSVAAAEAGRERVATLRSEMAAAKVGAMAKIFEEINSTSADIGVELARAVEEFSRAIDALGSGLVRAAVQAAAKVEASRPETFLTSPPAITKTNKQPEPPFSEVVTKSDAVRDVASKSSEASSVTLDSALIVRVEPTSIALEPHAASDEIESDAISDAELAELTSMGESAATDSAPGAAPKIENATSARTNAALRALVLEGQFGLAYHLAAAARALNPEDTLVIAPEEARFISLSGHLNHPTLQGNPDEVQRWVVELLDRLESSVRDEDFDRAVNLLVVPSAVELSLFHPNSGALEVLRRVRGDPTQPTHRQLRGIGSELYDVVGELISAVEKISHSTGVVLTQSILASVESEMDCGTAAASLRKQILADIVHFGKMKFDFQLGVRVRNALMAAEHDLGRLGGALEQDDKRALDEAKAFVASANDRSSILAMLQRAEGRVEGLRARGIDGAARNKLVAEIIKIRDETARYAEARSEMIEAREQDRSKVREWVAELRRRLGAFTAAVRTQLDSLSLGAACSLTLPRLGTLDKLLAGKGRTSSSVERLLTLHGPLALIPDIHFGRSWFPTPYNAAAVVATLESLSLPLSLPLLPTRSDERELVFAGIMKRRRDDRSFAAARLLLEMATDLGIGEEVRAEQTARLEDAVANAREALRERLEAVEGRIEKVLRFGAVSSETLETAEALMSQVRQVKSTDVFVEISAEERVEQIDESVSDARLAFDLLDDVNERAATLLNQPREELAARIQKLSGRLSDSERASLTGLVADDDLHTAEEWIETAEATGSLPTASSRKTRIQRFIDALPALAQSTDKPAEFIEQQRDFCGIRFSELTAMRAQESAALFGAWKDLQRRLPNMRDINFSAQFMSFMEKIGFTGKITPGEALPSRKLYTANHEMSFAADQDGLLLPDFGSRSKGQRLVLTAAMPTEGVLTELCEAAGAYYVVLFVTEVVNPHRRLQFLVSNIRANRKVILVDTASLLFALGEQETRPLTLLELGQPYSFVAPYKDWDREAVPPEMFVGREEDFHQIFAAEGSCVVYGGRRMGKTALLHHIKHLRDDPAGGTLVGYVDVQPNLGSLDNPARIWSVLADSLPAIFPGTRSQGLDQAKFTRDVRSWLMEDQRRRVILCIDECDKFVVADAAQDYRVFLALQQLMVETRRRFKFVLSGLADVTRLAQTGNSPLKHISVNPRRIGPLMGAELRSAERLVLRPFAALGMEFEKRQDVWRLLSHSNYYPVLIQTYSQRLLARLLETIREEERPIAKVSSQLVASVLDDVLLRSVIKEIFVMTLRIDPRYQVIAYAIAYYVLNSEAEGKLDDGISVGEIRDAALYWWPKGFAERNRLSLIEDLLDEMEGLGVLRKIRDTDRWSLRSSAVLRLLGSRGDIENGLGDFIDREAPREFDPKSLRRSMERSGRRASPLTLSQERDLLRDATLVNVVVGCEIADIGLVAAALRSAPESFSDASAFEVDAQKFATREELIERIRRHRPATGVKLTVVVTSESEWTPEWVVDVLRLKPVSDGRVKVVFAGHCEHVDRLVGDARFRRTVTGVRIMPLEPWSDAFVDRIMTLRDLNWDDVRDDANARTGGWNSVMNRLADRAYQLRTSERTTATLERIVREVELPPETAMRQTVRGRVAQVLTAVAKWYPSSPFRIEDIDVCLGLDGGAAVVASGIEVVAAGVLLGLIVPIPAPTGGAAQTSQYAFSEFASRILRGGVAETTG